MEGSHRVEPAATSGNNNVGTKSLSLTCSKASVEDILDEDILGVLGLNSSDLKHVVQTFGSVLHRQGQRLVQF